MFVFRFTIGVPWVLRFHWWHRHFFTNNMITAWYWTTYSEWLEITTRWFLILSTANNLNSIWSNAYSDQIALLDTAVFPTCIVLIHIFDQDSLAACTWNKALERCVYFNGVNVYSSRLFTALYFVGMYPVTRHNGLSHAGFANWPGHLSDTITKARHSRGK